MSTTSDRQTYQASHAFFLTIAICLVVIGVFFTVLIRAGHKRETR